MITTFIIIKNMMIFANLIKIIIIINLIMRIRNLIVIIITIIHFKIVIIENEEGEWRKGNINIIRSGNKNIKNNLL